MFSAVHQHYRQTDAPDFAAGRVTGLSIGYRPAGGFFVPKKCTMYHKDRAAARAGARDTIAPVNFQRWQSASVNFESA